MYVGFDLDTVKYEICYSYIYSTYVRHMESYLFIYLFCLVNNILLAILVNDCHIIHQCHGELIRHRELMGA
jgi:hypothetical protein